MQMRPTPPQRHRVPPPLTHPLCRLPARALLRPLLRPLDCRAPPARRRRPPSCTPAAPARRTRWIVTSATVPQAAQRSTRARKQTAHQSVPCKPARPHAQGRRRAACPVWAAPPLWPLSPVHTAPSTATCPMPPLRLPRPALRFPPCRRAPSCARMTLTAYA
ncbi:hypothetical protein PSPO01_02014 [Paraphaeosphaeria sporulosa]